MFLFKLENSDEIYAMLEPEFVEGAYIPDTRYFTAEDLKISKEEFKKIKSSTDLMKYFKDEEEFEEWRDDLPFLPQIAEGYYCEDKVAKEDIEELEKEDVKFIVDDTIWDVLSDGDFDEYFTWWDGQNWRCHLVTCKEEIEAKEIEDMYENHNTYHYDYWEYKGLKFRRHISHYQGELPTLDEEWGDAKKIIEKFC